MSVCFTLRHSISMKILSQSMYRKVGRDSSVGIATGYGLEARGSKPCGVEIFRTRPDRLWCPPSLLYNEYRVFPGGKEQPKRDADTSPLLVTWSRKSRAISLLPLCAVRPVQSLSACTRVHFTYLLTYLLHGAESFLRS